MRMDAIEIASVLMTQAGDDGSIGPEDVLALAECITLGGGGFRVADTTTCFLVLGAVTKAVPLTHPRHMPVILRLSLPVIPRKRQVLTTHGAAHLWRERARNANQRPPGYTKSWAPSATQSYARLT